MRGVDSLQRLSMLLALAGLITIYVSSAVLAPERVEIEDIGEEELGKAVRVSGEVKDLGQSEDAVFFELQGKQESISSVYFGEGLGVKEGGHYTFKGRVKIYHGELELVVENVVSGGSSLDHPG